MVGGKIRGQRRVLPEARNQFRRADELMMETFLTTAVLLNCAHVSAQILFDPILTVQSNQLLGQQENSFHIPTIFLHNTLRLRQKFLPNLNSNDFLDRLDFEI